MSNVIKLPIRGKGSAERVMKKIQELIDAGLIDEVMIFAPDAKDAQNFYYVFTDGLTLTNLLMAKQTIGVMADQVFGEA